MFYPSFMPWLSLFLLLSCLITAGQTQSGTNRDGAVSQGDLSRARTELEAQHAADPTNLKIAIQLANIYIRMQRHAEAVDLLMPLEPGHETNMDLEYSLAYALIQSGKEAEGIVRMENVARTTRSANAWTIAGGARLHRNELAEARSDLDSALALNPSLPGLYSLAAQVRHAQGDARGAVPLFQAALRADPRDFEANLHLGIYLLEQGDYESARPLLQLAEQLDPASPLARLKLAKLNEMTGNDAEAQAVFEQLEESNPEWLDPHIELARMYYKQHRIADSQRERNLIEQIEAREQKSGPSKQ